MNAFEQWSLYKLYADVICEAFTTDEIERLEAMAEAGFVD